MLLCQDKFREFGSLYQQYNFAVILMLESRLYARVSFHDPFSITNEPGFVHNVMLLTIFAAIAVFE